MWGRRVIGISGSLFWSKTLMEQIFNACGEFRWSPEGPHTKVHSPHPHAYDPGIFSDLLRFVQIRKRKWGAEGNGKLAHLFVPDKTAVMVPEFAVEDLPSAELRVLVPALAMKDLSLRRTLWWWWWWWCCWWWWWWWWYLMYIFLQVLLSLPRSIYSNLLQTRKDYPTLS